MSATERLEYLRGEIRAERISYGEIAELQGLAEHIDPSDVELLEWAGVPEFGEDDEDEELPDTCLAPDGHWYVITYGRARWQIHAKDCPTCQA